MLTVFLSAAARSRFFVTSPALGRRIEQADQHARARSRNDVEFHARIVKRGHRARHQCQIRRAAAQYQCDCRAYTFFIV